MTRRIGVVLAAFAFAFCLAFVGCASGVNKANYVGVWTLESYSDEGMSEGTFESLRMLGLEVTLTLEEEGAGTLDLFGEVTNLTWEAESNAEGSIVLGGDEDNKALIKLADGKLTIEASDGTSMTFARSSNEISAASAASSGSAASQGTASEGAIESAEPSESGASPEESPDESAASPEAEPEEPIEAVPEEETTPENEPAPEEEATSASSE